MAGKRSKYIQQHGNGYRVRIVVPPELREILGKTNLYAPIPGALTESAALSKSYGIVAKLQAQIDAARSVHTETDPIVAEALHRRQFIKQRGLRETREPPSDIATPADFDEAIYDDEYDAMIDRAYEIEAKHGLKSAKGFVAIANRRSTPIREHLAAFLQFKSYREKTETDLLRAMDWLEQWLSTLEIPCQLEAVDRRVGLLPVFRTPG